MATWPPAAKSLILNDKLVSNKINFFAKSLILKDNYLVNLLTKPLTFGVEMLILVIWLTERKKL